MNHYLGFDGGGTKTECVVIDAAGRVVSQAVAGPSNPLRVGPAEAFAALTAAAATALVGIGLESRDIRAVCAGLAGAGRPSVVQEVMAFLGQAFPQSLAHVAPDFEVALEAAAGPGPGVVLIAGTGSSAYGRNSAGESARAGGHGPWIGDEGSAFDIGRRAVVAVACARDLDSPAPRLAKLIPAALGISRWEELTERIATNPDEVFPPLFPVVVKAADGGDEAARELLTSAAAALADLAATVIRRLRLEKTEFPLAKSGGVFGRSALLDESLDNALRHLAPRGKVSLLGVSPAVGAAQLAKRLAGAEPATAAHGAQG